LDFSRKTEAITLCTAPEFFEEDGGAGELEEVWDSIYLTRKLKTFWHSGRRQPDRFWFWFLWWGWCWEMRSAEMDDANELETSNDEEVHKISFLSPWNVCSCGSEQVSLALLSEMTLPYLSIAVLDERMNQQSDGMKVYHMDSLGG
jgi:hypothetical protein